MDKLSLKVFQSLRELYFGPLGVFLKRWGTWGGDRGGRRGSQNRSNRCDLLLSFYYLSKRQNMRSEPSPPFSDARPVQNARDFWLMFGPDRLTSGSTSVPQYYHLILSAPVVSHGTAVSNPAVAKSSSRPEEAACRRTHSSVGA